MFERFTDRARRSMVLANEEATLAGSDAIHPGHILAGLIHEGEGVAAKALDEFGIDLEQVRFALRELHGLDTPPSSGSLSFTPRTKKIIELGLREALQLGHNYIGTEHLLLGILREGESDAAIMLAAGGADLGHIRRKVIEILSGYGGPRPNPLWVEVKMSVVSAKRDLEWLVGFRSAVWRYDVDSPVDDLIDGLRAAIAQVTA